MNETYPEEKCRMCDKDLSEKPRIEIRSRGVGYSSEFEFETWDYSNLAYLCSRECMIAYAINIVIQNKNDYKNMPLENEEETVRVKTESFDEKSNSVTTKIIQTGKENNKPEQDKVE